MLTKYREQGTLLGGCNWIEHDVKRSLDRVQDLEISESIREVVPSPNPILRTFERTGDYQVIATFTDGSIVQRPFKSAQMYEV